MLTEEDFEAIQDLVVDLVDSGGPDVGDPAASEYYATASELTSTPSEPASVGSGIHDLEALVVGKPWKFHCPGCHKTSQVRGPFDLERFRCVVCEEVFYPFIEMEGRHVDLRRLRTFLINLYYRRDVADEVLLALAASNTAPKALELDLPPRLILGHALSSLLVHIEAECEQPYAYFLMGCIFPLLPWAFRISNLYEFRDTLKCTSKDGAFARRSFDPSILPFRERLGAAVHLPRLDRLTELFCIGPITDPLQTTDHDGYAESLGEGVHDWSIAVDRRLKRAGIENETRDLAKWGVAQTTEFCSAVVHWAMTPRRGMLERSLDLRIIDPHDASLTQRTGTGIEEDTSSSSKVARLIEVVDPRHGCILRTIIHVMSSRHMVGVDWQVLQRTPSGAEFLCRGEWISAEADLCRHDIFKERGSRWDTELSRTAADMGPLLAAIASCILPIALLSLFGPIGYICFVAVHLSGLWRAYYRRWFPLPSFFGDEGRRGLIPSYFGFSRAVHAARITEWGRIEQRWGQANSSSRPSLTAAFMSTDGLASMNADEIRFSAWAHNEQVANGVISAARALGIDTDESEKKILEIVNHGVIAHRIGGDVKFGAKRTSGTASSRRDNHRRSKRSNARSSHEDHPSQSRRGR